MPVPEPSPPEQHAIAEALSDVDTEQHQITISGVQVQVIRKAIKNLHLGVYPPNGRVRVATPLKVSDEAVRLAVISKLGWIKRQRSKFEGQTRQSRREMVSGESHYYLGRRYRLRVIEQEGAGRVVVKNRRTLELHVRPKSGQVQREQVLQLRYRQHLRELIPPLLIKWATILEVQPAAWGIKRMKTKWGAVLSFFILFWVLEDFLWFLLNPAFGLKRFRPDNIWWHAPKWWWIMPRDYWIFTPVGILLYCLSYATPTS